MRLKSCRILRCASHETASPRMSVAYDLLLGNQGRSWMTLSLELDRTQRTTAQPCSCLEFIRIRVGQINRREHSWSFRITPKYTSPLARPNVVYVCSTPEICILRAQVFIDMDITLSISVFLPSTYNHGLEMLYIAIRKPKLSVSSGKRS